MPFISRAVILLFLLLAVSFQPDPAGPGAFAQDRPAAQERILREIEIRGFKNVAGLQRRGGNYVFQAEDLFGEKVRVVMNAETGEIVGLSRNMPQKK
jgi:hypothetical protein